MTAKIQEPKPIPLHRMRDRLVMVDGIALVRCNKCLRELPASKFTNKDQARNCRDCRSGLALAVRDRKANKKLAEAAMTVAERVARRDAEPISRDDRIFNTAISDFGGTEGVGHAIHDLYVDPETKHGTKKDLLRLIVEGVQRSEARKLDKRNLNNLEADELSEAFFDLLGINPEDLEEDLDDVLDSDLVAEALPLPEPVERVKPEVDGVDDPDDDEDDEEGEEDQDDDEVDDLYPDVMDAVVVTSATSGEARR